MAWRYLRFLLPGFAILALAALAVWRVTSEVDATTAFIQDKVVGVLALGLRDVATTPYAQRERVTDAAGRTFYAPTIIGQPDAEFVVLKDALEQLNQDARVPPLRFANVQTSSDYATDLRATATVEFEVYPWLNRTITVSAAIPVVRYQRATGPNLSMIRAPGSYLPRDIVRVTVSYQYATVFERLGSTGFHSGGFVTVNRILTRRRDVVDLIDAINAIPRYATTADLRCSQPVNAATATLTFVRSNGQSIPAMSDSAGCEGFIIGGPMDRIDFSYYPPLPAGKLWTLLNRLAPSGFSAN